MEEKSTLSERHQKHRDEMWPMQNWRAWGSWFSWGSPIGLSLGYGITVISTGVFLWFLHLAGYVH